LLNEQPVAARPAFRFVATGANGGLAAGSYVRDVDETAFRRLTIDCCGSKARAAEIATFAARPVRRGRLARGPVSG